MESTGLGPKATIPLGFLSFLRGSFRLKSVLKLLVDSPVLSGFGGFLSFLRGLVRLRFHWTCSRTPRSCGGLSGGQRSKKGGIDGSGLQGNCSTWFFVLFEGFV